MVILGLLSLPGWLLCTICITLALYWYAYRKQTTFKRLGIPGPIGRPFVGQLRRVRRTGLFTTDLELVTEYGKCFGVCLGNVPMLMVVDADMIREICVKQFHNFPFRGQAVGLTKFWKAAVTNADGEHWKFLRSTLSPAFTSGKLRSMGNIFQKCFDGFIVSIEKDLEQSDTIDFRKIFEGLTMDVVCSTSMGIDVDSQRNPDNTFVQSARKIMRLQVENNPLIISTLLFPELRGILQFLNVEFFDREAVDFIKTSTFEAIEERRKGGPGKYTDALQLMVDSCKGSEDKIQEPCSFEDYKNRGMTTTEVISNATTFLLAGYDTTSSTLTFIAYYLALNEDCQEKLFKEIKDVVGSSTLSYDHLARMDYLEMCMNETLRLNPAASRTSREAIQDTVIGNGITVTKGMTVILPIYALHRMPEYWPDPDKFDPERFSSQNKDSIHPYTYMPFGVGPRNCIGMRMAIMEIKLAIATLVQRYRLKVSPETQVPMRYEANFFIKPEGKVWLKVERR